MTAQERAWLGEKVREAVMLEVGVDAETVQLIDGRAFGRHSLPGLRRLSCVAAPDGRAGPWGGGA